MTNVRTCGGCTACCKTHPVVSIAKFGLVWCPNCTQGVGCRIYASRPAECAAFKCQWLMDFGGGEDRPDKVLIVVDYSRNPVLNNNLVAILWEVSSNALQGDFAQKTTNVLMSLKVPIMHIACNGSHFLFLPKGFNLSQEAYDTFTADGVPMKYYHTP